VSKKETKKPSVLMIAILAATAALSSLAASAVVRALFRTQGENRSVDDVLAKAADETNRRLPMMLDQFTRLDSTVALPQGKLMYKYTIVNLNPLPDRNTLIDKMRPNMINAYKTSQDMAGLRKLRVTLVYKYADEKGNELAQFEIGPQDIQ
jgi:hypothetical protein